MSDSLQNDLATENARLRSANAKLVKALREIAEEQKIYLGHGNYTIEPALDANGAQALAQRVLTDILNAP